MTIYNIGILLIVFAIGADLISLRKEVRRLSMGLMNKIDKPRAETPSEKFIRERQEKISVDKS